MKFAPLPAQSDLLAKFIYSPETGELRRVSTGLPCASRDRDGYIRVGVSGRDYAAHRIIWKMVYGVDPLMVDHADGCRTNNRVENLREASRSENGANSRVYASNRSGFKGVCWDANAGKWRADTNFHGRKVYIGLFATKEEAAQAYADRVNGLFGEFARVA